MNVDPAQPVVLASPRLLHAMLVAGVVIIMVVLGVVRAASALDPLTSLIPYFRLAAMGVLIASYVVMRILRLRIEPRRATEDRRHWWQRHLTTALAVWALAEGAAMVGAVFWFLTGDTIILVGVAGLALTLLVMNRPGRLEEG